MLPSGTCWSTEVAVWELGSSPTSDLAMDAPYIHSQPVLQKLFSCMKSCRSSSDRTISVRHFWFVARARNVMSGKKLKEESGET